MNTGVVRVIERLNDFFGIKTSIYDPWANINEVMCEYNLEVEKYVPKDKFDAIILAGLK